MTAQLTLSHPTELLRSELQTAGGFTYDATTQELLRPILNSGYAIAVPGTETALGAVVASARDFAQLLYHVLAELPGGDTMLGGWVADDRVIVEHTRVVHCARRAAVELGRLLDQDAIFDLGTATEIRCW